MKTCDDDNNIYSDDKSGLHKRHKMRIPTHLLLMLIFKTSCASAVQAPIERGASLLKQFRLPCRF